MKNITDYLEKEQVDQVLAAAHQCSTRDYLMLRVLWRTGVRVNELLTITPHDIEPHNSVVNVTKAKGGKQRRVHFPFFEMSLRVTSSFRFQRFLTAVLLPAAQMHLLCKQSIPAPTWATGNRPPTTSLLPTFTQCH